VDQFEKVETGAWSRDIVEWTHMGRVQKKTTHKKVRRVIPYGTKRVPRGTLKQAKREVGDAEAPRRVWVDSRGCSLLVKGWLNLCTTASQ